MLQVMRLQPTVLGFALAATALSACAKPATVAPSQSDRGQALVRSLADPKARDTAYCFRLCLCGRASDVLGSRTFRPLANIELDAVTLAQICEPLAIDRTLVKEIVLPRLVLDEPKSLVDS